MFSLRLSLSLFSFRRELPPTSLPTPWNLLAKATLHSNTDSHKQGHCTTGFCMGSNAGQEKAYLKGNLLIFKKLSS